MALHIGMTAPCLRAVTIPIAACHCGCSAVGLTIKCEHGAGAFNDALAAAGYIVKVIELVMIPRVSQARHVATDVAGSNNFIIANLKNGAALPGSEYPLRLVGAGLSTKGQSVSQVTEIQLLPGIHVDDGSKWQWQYYARGRQLYLSGELDGQYQCHCCKWLAVCWLDRSRG